MFSTRPALQYLTASTRVGTLTVGNLAKSSYPANPKFFESKWRAVIMESSIESNLVLDSLHFHPQSATLCFRSLKKACSETITLERITIGKNSIGTFIPIIFESIAQNPTIKQLEINECGVDSKVAEIIAQHVNKLNLSDIDLSESMAEICGTKKLLDNLSGHYKTLILRDQKLTDQDCELLKSHNVKVYSSHSYPQ